MKCCLECSKPATHRRRCKEHYLAYQSRPAVKARRERRRELALLYDAAAAARKAARDAGYARCEGCGDIVVASSVDVDHIVPLSLGGTDTADNIRYLCRSRCHPLATARLLA